MPAWPIPAERLQAARRMYVAGVKTAATGELYPLSGVFHLREHAGRRSGVLTVPAAFVKGVFAALESPGVQLPAGAALGAVLVFTAAEIAKIGPEKMTPDRGKRFNYRVGRLVEIGGSGEISRAWGFEVVSPELGQLRRSYGLEGSGQFLIPIAVRRKGVLGSGPASKTADLADDVDAAAKRTDTAPTEGQIEAGNYAKGKVWYHGMRVSIENPKGSTRSGTSGSGKAWSQTMTAHYGYFLGTEGKDGDHVDIFIGPEPDIELVYVVNQVKPGTDTFDEHKAIGGVRTLKEAKALYLSNYEDGWTGMGDVCAMTMEQFKWWMRNCDTTKPIRNGFFAAPGLRKVAADGPADEPRPWWARVQS